MSSQSFNSSGRAPRAGGVSPVEDEFISDEKAIDKFSTASRAVPTHSAQQTVKPVNLLAKAVALLSRREHSEQELRRKLAKYTDDVQQIDTVIARLQKENWQSDERFAENFVLFRQERWGNQKNSPSLAPTSSLYRDSHYPQRKPSRDRIQSRSRGVGA